MKKENPATVLANNDDESNPTSGSTPTDSSSNPSEDCVISTPNSEDEQLDSKIVNLEQQNQQQQPSRFTSLWTSVRRYSDTVFPIIKSSDENKKVENTPDNNNNNNENNNNEVKISQNEQTKSTDSSLMKGDENEEDVDNNDNNNSEEQLNLQKDHHPHHQQQQQQEPPKRNMWESVRKFSISAIDTINETASTVYRVAEPAATSTAQAVAQSAQIAWEATKESTAVVVEKVKNVSIKKENNSNSEATLETNISNNNNNNKNENEIVSTTETIEKKEVEENKTIYDNNNNNNSNNNISNNNNNNGNGNNGNNNNDNNTIAIDDDFPVFRQVKMARISYKPNTSALSLPYSKYDVFGFNPPPPFPSIEITTPQPVFGPDPTPLDVTSMKHALAHISELPPDVSTLSPTASEINNNNNKTINLNINPTIVQDDSVNE